MKMNKANLRRALLHRRRALCKTEVENFGQRISASVLHWILQDTNVHDDIAMKQEDLTSVNVKSVKESADAKRRTNLSDVLILGYMPIQNEVNVCLLMEELGKLGAGLALPRVIDATRMEFHMLNQIEPFAHLCIGRFGIPEPSAKSPVCDIPSYKRVYLLLPCVGVHHNKTRLGFGAGYYDRYFHTECLQNMEKKSVVLRKIAAVYPFQKDLEFDAEEFDIRADIVFAE